MIEVLRFIFSDLFIWLGTVILIAVFGDAVAKIIAAARGES